MKKKTVALLLALVLVFGVIAGGTVAWLIDKTDPVTNTFTYGDINIELTETLNTDTNHDETNDAWEAKIAPGYKYTKDPVVTVKANNEKCYLFVRLTVTQDIEKYVSYISILSKTGSEWTQGDGKDIPSDVWYLVVEPQAKDKSWNLLEGNEVSISEKLTKGDIKDLAADATFTMTYQAYACQYYKDNVTTPKDATDTNIDAFGHYFTAAEAWKLVSVN